MGFFQFLKSPAIDQGIQDYKATPGAVLLDRSRHSVQAVP